MAWKRSSVRIRYSPQTVRFNRAFFMPYHVYILYSRQLERFYVGETEDVEVRLKSHLLGISRYTSAAKDWTLVYLERFETRSQSIAREKEIKRKKSRKYIEWLIATKD
jgi:putative endonuclease